MNYDYLIDTWKQADIESFDYLFAGLSKVKQECFLIWIFHNKDYLQACDVEHLFAHALKWFMDVPEIDCTN